MAWTYSGNPANSPLDGVRFLIQDTVAIDPQLQDAEITFLIVLYTNIFKSAAYAARNIASKYARQIDKSDGDLRLTYSQRQKAYMDMANDLLRQAANRTSLPWAGGLAVAERMEDGQNTGLIQPKFRKNQFSEPIGGQNGDFDIIGGPISE